MIVNRESNNVTVIGGGEKMQFSTANSEMAYDVLTKTIYSDAEAAVIREICCNAADAHKQVGEDKPFSVILPTEEHKIFVVEDWGPGISHEDMQKVYCSLFSSTKRSSNTQTGCFGIGAKTPFALGSFTIKSVQDNIERTYAAVKEEGSRHLVLMDTREVDKKSGFTVLVPIKNIRAFNEKAKGILAWFDPIPEGFTPHYNPYPEWEGEYITFGANTNAVLMGNVLYPIKRVHTPRAGEMVSTVNIVLKAKIGDVDVTASREELEYTERTIKWIKEVGYPNAVKELKEIDRKQKAALKTDWERALVTRGPIYSNARGIWLSVDKITKTETSTGTPTVNRQISYEQLRKGIVFFHGEASKKNIRIRNYIDAKGISARDAFYINNVKELPDGAPIIDVASLPAPVTAAARRKSVPIDASIVTQNMNSLYSVRGFTSKYAGDYVHLKGNIVSELGITVTKFLDICWNFNYNLSKVLFVKRKLPKAKEISSDVREIVKKWVQSRPPNSYATVPYYMAGTFNKLKGEKIDDPELRLIVEKVQTELTSKEVAASALYKPERIQYQKVLNRYPLLQGGLATPGHCAEYVNWLYNKEKQSESNRK